VSRRALVVRVIAGLALGAAVGAAFVVAVRALRAREAGQGATYTAVAIVGVRTTDGWFEREAEIEGVGRSRRTEFRGVPGYLLDDGATLRVLGADGALAVLAGSESGADLSALSPAYTVTRGTGAPVAGRPVDKVTLTRNATGREAMVVEADRDTGVALRKTSYRQDGTVVSRTEVTRIRYGAVLRHSMAAPASESSAPGEEAGAEMTEGAFRAFADFSPVAPSAIPAGYAPVGFHGHQCEHGRWYAEYRYSDGLRALSVFERHPRGQGGPQGGGAGGGRGRGYGGGRGNQAGAGSESAEPGTPQAGSVVVVDEGFAVTFRQRRGDRVVLVTGDVTRTEALAVLDSVPIE